MLRKASYLGSFQAVLRGTRRASASVMGYRYNDDNYMASSTFLHMQTRDLAKIALSACTNLMLRLLAYGRPLHPIFASDSPDILLKSSFLYVTLIYYSTDLTYYHAY